MSSLRILGISYLATASLFVLAIACADQAALRMVTDRAARAFNDEIQARLVMPLLAFARAQDEIFLDPPAPVRLPLAPPGPNDARTLARAAVPVMPEKTLAPPPIAMPLIIAPDLPDVRVAPDVPPPLPHLAQPQRPDAAMPDLPPGELALSPAQRAAVTARLAETLTPEMLRNFSLFLYVSKADHGPLSQRLYVFRKNARGELDLAYDWAASTGREKYEVTPLGQHTRTDTPAGFYELDPDRMYRHYHSRAWDQAMPYAMFFNWQHQGDQTGLAIHAASGGDIARLGARASAGCVHISPEHARQLYEMIRSDYKGAVPRFAYDRAAQTMSNTGEMMRDANGNLVMADGYKVLIDIEDFGGAQVATLY